MPPQLALLLYFGLIVWLFRHAKCHGWSKELWIPLVWILIVGSKTPALWLAILTKSGRDPEGSNLDTAILLGLLVAGFRVLARRKTNWQAAIGNNKWLFIYFAYVGVSVVWSDEPFGSLKLWVKDAGNLIMVMVVLSGQYAGDAVKGTLLRASYVLMPLSVLLIKYFPEIGRGYDRWTYQPIMLGASDSKNTLGAIILVCSVALLANAFDRQVTKSTSRSNKVINLVLILMTLWLLVRSNCATALACAITALVIFLLMKFPVTREVTKKLGIWVLVLVPALLVLSHYVLDLGQLFFGSLGRNVTLTGRTDIWAAALDSVVNPLFGSGYASFWYGERAHAITKKLGFFFDLKEAHNGYLETYLNCGAIGLLLLLCALGVGTARILKQLGNGNYQTARLAWVIVALMYNVSEAAFSGLNPVWFLLMLALVEYPRPPTAEHGRTILFADDVDQFRGRFAEPPGYVATV